MCILVFVCICNYVILIALGVHISEFVLRVRNVRLCTGSSTRSQNAATPFTSIIRHVIRVDYDTSRVSFSLSPALLNPGFVVWVNVAYSLWY